MRCILQNGLEEMQQPLHPIPEQKFYGPNYHMTSHVTSPTYQVAQVVKSSLLLFILSFSSSLTHLLFSTFSNSLNSIIHRLNLLFFIFFYSSCLFHLLLFTFYYSSSLLYLILFTFSFQPSLIHLILLFIFSS